MTWETTKTSASYTPAVQLEQGKPPRRCNVTNIRLVTLAQARRMVADGKIVWVRADEWDRAQADAAEDAAREGVGSGETVS